MCYYSIAATDNRAVSILCLYTILCILYSLSISILP